MLIAQTKIAKQKYLENRVYLQLPVNPGECIGFGLRPDFLGATSGEVAELVNFGSPLLAAGSFNRVKNQANI